MLQLLRGGESTLIICCSSNGSLISYPHLLRHLFETILTHRYLFYTLVYIPVYVVHYVVQTVPALVARNSSLSLVSL